MGYLFFGGLGFLCVPDATLRMLSSNTMYDDAIVRLVGAFLLALFIVVARMVYLRLEAFYTTSLYVRVHLLAVVLWLYQRSSNLFFITFAGIIGVGVVLTAVGFLAEQTNC